MHKRGNKIDKFLFPDSLNAHGQDLAHIGRLKNFCSTQLKGLKIKIH